MDLSCKKQEYFGLDISDFSLKIAKVNKSDMKLTSFSEADIAPGIIDVGEVKDEDALAKIIIKAMNDAKLKTKHVVASLPEEKSFLDVVQIPLMSEEEIETAVKYEIENHIPVSIDKVYFDFQKIKALDKYQEVLIAATPKNIVNGYLNSIKKAGLQPVALEIECLSIIRALIDPSKAVLPLLIVDFGGSRTTFIIYSGKSLRFTSSFPFSSQHLNKAISEKMGISIKAAESLKIKQGFHGEIKKAVTPLLNKLAIETKTHIEYFRTHEKSSKKDVEKVLLCGGGANLKGLPEFLASKLKVEVELSNPWINILKKKTLKQIPLMPFEQSLSYTTALGLAIYD